MITPEQLAAYRAGWKRYEEKKKQELEIRYNEARKRVQKAADHLKQNYRCNVYLFGSLTRKEAFTESSDIDIAVSDLSHEVNFWQVYSEVMNILAPFDFDLIELERIEPVVREHILKKGVKL